MRLRHVKAWSGRVRLTSVAYLNNQGNHFRTAPLRRLGRRIFFLGDDRTIGLQTPITELSCNGSEAMEVEENIASPSSRQKQDLPNFLRSL